jgi:SAM-dependent methyltransferase
MAEDEVTRHYETVLAANYTWMFGVSFDAKVAEQRDLLSRVLGDELTRPGPAIDLGSGPGYQSIALADLGFIPVVAVDTSQALLDELKEHRNGRPIETACADLRDVRRIYGQRRARIVVCMGDTLTHLPDVASVTQLFADAFELLKPGGLLMLTFRDLSAALEGLDRFIPIRSDADRIMTCFLEYEPAFVRVHDLIHTRTGDSWTLHKSSYKKLRLSSAEVAEQLADAGFHIVRNEPIGRLQSILARRP